MTFDRRITKLKKKTQNKTTQQNKKKQTQTSPTTKGRK